MGIKMGKLNYEIKASIHTNDKIFYFKNIRPDHNIDYYILCCYDLWYRELGRAYIFKVPSLVMNGLICLYSYHASGSFKTLGIITMNNQRGRTREFKFKAGHQMGGKTSKSTERGKSFYSLITTMKTFK